VKLNWMNDLGAPAVVTAVDLVTETVGTPAGQYNEAASYVVAAGSYAAALLGYGGDFVLNMGIAGFPWAAKNIYKRVKAMTGTAGMPARAMAVRRVAPAGIGRWPAPAQESPFNTVRLV
jgi:hypothetical protein